jgi:hypothetical protein
VTALTSESCAYDSSALASRTRLPIFAYTRFFAQFIQFLRSQIAQGLLTREQAQERLASLRTSIPQAPHPPPQQTIQCSRLPALPEERFKVLFAQFANTTGLKLNPGNFVIGGRPINAWALHRVVFARNGFDYVCPWSRFIILSIYICLGYCKP